MNEFIWSAFQTTGDIEKRSRNFACEHGICMQVNSIYSNVGITFQGFFNNLSTSLALHSLPRSVGLASVCVMMRCVSFLVQ